MVPTMPVASTTHAAVAGAETVVRVGLGGGDLESLSRVQVSRVRVADALHGGGARQERTSAMRRCAPPFSTSFRRCRQAIPEQLPRRLLGPRGTGSGRCPRTWQGVSPGCPPGAVRPARVAG